MFSLFAMGQRAQDLITKHQPCRPSDFPPYDAYDENLEYLDERDPDPISPWVQRAQANTLPTFSTHQSAHAYLPEHSHG